MNTDKKLRQGTDEWFDMVGAIVRDEAAQADLPADFNLSLVERYTDGIALGDGYMQGIRLDIEGGKLIYRIGVRPGEHAELVIELTADAARRLNLLYNADPAFLKMRDQLLSSGDMRLTGDFSRLGDWFAEVHDPIVDRAC